MSGHAGSAGPLWALLCRHPVRWTIQGGDLTGQSRNTSPQMAKSPTFTVTGLVGIPFSGAKTLSVESYPQEKLSTG